MHPDRTGTALCDHNVAVGFVSLSQRTGSLTLLALCCGCSVYSCSNSAVTFSPALTNAQSANISWAVFAIPKVMSDDKYLITMQMQAIKIMYSYVYKVGGMLYRLSKQAVQIATIM